MAPEIKVFISALRSGRSCADAFTDYCWAKSVVPIKREDLEQLGDPFRCPPAWSMADAMGADAFEAGGDDDAIEAAFNAGLAEDTKRGVVWRAMRKEERPTPADLIRAMDRESQHKAAEIFGIRPIAHAIAGGEITLR